MSTTLSGIRPGQAPGSSRSTDPGMMENPEPSPRPAASSERLLSRSFVGLLLTQFLGAMNDNMFRWLAVPIAKPVLGDAEALSLGLISFTLPYLLLAAPASASAP